MKKNLLILIVLVAVLAGAGGALLMLNREDAPGEEDSAAEEIYIMGGIPQPFIKQLTIQNELDSFTVRNGHENAIQQQNADSPSYEVDGVDPVYLNMTMLRSVMNTASGLTAKSIVAGGADNLALYGLDNPRATVEAVYEDGTASIRIGGDAPGSEGVYVAAGNEVYLVSSSQLTYMLNSRLDFVARAVTGGDPQAAAFTRFKISGTHLPEPIVIRESDTENEAASLLGKGSYQISEPVRAGLDLTYGLEYLAQVFGMYADGVAALAEDSDALAAYGLQTPALTLEVDAADPETGSFTLYISEPDEQGDVYVRRADRPFIYRMSASAAPWLELGLFDYQDKMIILPYIDRLSQIDVETGGKLYSFRLTGEGEDLAVAVDGRELEVDNFRQFYQTLVVASYDSQADESTSEPDPSDAVLRYTYHFRDGSAASTVAFYPGPSRRYLVRLDEGPLYYATSIYVDRVIEDVIKVAAGEEVKSFI